MENNVYSYAFVEGEAIQIHTHMLNLKANSLNII